MYQKEVFKAPRPLQSPWAYVPKMLTSTVNYTSSFSWSEWKFYHNLLFFAINTSLDGSGEPTLGCLVKWLVKLVKELRSILRTPASNQVPSKQHISLKQITCSRFGVANRWWVSEINMYQLRQMWIKRIYWYNKTKMYQTLNFLLSGHFYQ